MSNHCENEMLREDLFLLWVEHLVLQGWPDNSSETYDEAVRRTEPECAIINE